MTLKTIRDELIARDLCDHCLGRQFGMIGHGLENYERGAILRRTDNPTRSDITPEKIPKEASRGDSCHLCDGLFERITEFADRIIDRVEPYQFDTYVVGSRIRTSMLNEEERLQNEIGVEEAERVNRELNRLIGKELERRYDGDISVHQQEADLMMIVDTREDEIELQVSSLYVFGRYNKYARDLPQTEWHCRKCRGSGCDYCDGTGKMYETSVQELIQSPFVEASEAREAVFHGAGREDIDARCLGKRPFVLELKHPLIRHLNLEELAEQVNQEHDEIDIYDLQITRSRTVGRIKQIRADKSYRAVVSLTDTVSDEALDQITDLEGEIEQDTPSRVAHRRSDRTRTRTVHSVEVSRRAADELELEVKAEAGTYIKELISGDQDRTSPNLSALLGTEATCAELDVLNVHEDIDVIPPAHKEKEGS
jgi:tRNA pseudouridine synthase 10